MVTSNVNSHWKHWKVNFELTGFNQLRLTNTRPDRSGSLEVNLIGLCIFLHSNWQESNLSNLKEVTEVDFQWQTHATQTQSAVRFRLEQSNERTDPQPEWRTSVFACECLRVYACGTILPTQNNTLVTRQQLQCKPIAISIPPASSRIFQRV